MKSSFFPRIFVDPRGRTARVLAVKVSTFFCQGTHEFVMFFRPLFVGREHFFNSSSVAALAVALAAETAASEVF